MDSHLREEYVMDGSIAGRQIRASDAGAAEQRKERAREFRHEFHPWPKEVTAHFNHSVVYDPQANWNGGEIARRQVGGWDMEHRLKENEKEGVDHQFLFPTQLSIPTYTEGELGAALCRAYNNWAKQLVKGKEDRLWPVGVVPLLAGRAVRALDPAQPHRPDPEPQSGWVMASV
jgi:hypothetical protein